MCVSAQAGLLGRTCHRRCIDPLARHDFDILGEVRRVRLAEDVDGIAGLQVAPGEYRIGIKREVTDRERADRVKNQDRDTSH